MQSVKTFIGLIKVEEFIWYAYDNDRRTILSEHLPYIQDINANSDNVIDLYIDERDKCAYNKYPWSNKPCDFEFKIKYYKDDLKKLSLNLIYYINYLKNALLKKNYFNYTYMYLINLS